MEPEGSLPCSQNPVTVLFPEPAEPSSPHRSLSPIPTLQRLLTFQVSNLMSFFGCLGRAKESVQVRGALKHFVTHYYFTVRGCWAHAQPQSWRRTPCRLSAAAYSIYSQLPSVSGSLFFIRNPMTCHAVVARDPPNMVIHSLYIYILSNYLHETESFLRNQHSQPRNPPPFTEPEGSLPCLQEPATAPNLNQMHPVHTSPPQFPKIHSNVIFLSTPHLTFLTERCDVVLSPTVWH
jgi:hypothetical protein